MNSGWFEHVVRRLNQQPRRVLLGCLLCLLLSGIGILFIELDGSVEIMLPTDSEAHRTIVFLRDANFANKVVINLSLTDPVLGTADLVAEMERMATSLRSAALIDRVIKFPGTQHMMDDLLFFLEHCGELLSAEDLVALDERLTPTAVDTAIRRCRMRLLKPEGSFVQEIIRRDPLDIGSVILGRIHKLTQAFGYSATIENGHLIHPDGRHGLLLLETSVPVTDTVRSRELMETVSVPVKRLSAGISADIISGHRHSIGNETRLRRDVRLTVSIAAIGFIILFLGIFRDPRAVIVFLIPAAAVLVALNISALLLDRLSYIVVGLGAVMAGIAVDYGIHVYVSNRHIPDPYLALRRILRPVILGALTTISVFAGFLFATIPGYRQLAVFAITSISLAILAAIFILPPLLKTGEAPLHSGNVRQKPPKVLAVPGAVFFLVSLVIAAMLARGLELDTGLVHLDGTPEHVLAAEERLKKLWSGRETGQAIAVVGGETYDEGAVKNDQLFHQVRTRDADLNFSNLAVFWPSRLTRVENLQRWNRFWTEERIASLRENVRAAAAKYGFGASAFNPFFQLLSSQREPTPQPEENMIFSQLTERFHYIKNDTHWFMSFYPDSAAANSVVAESIAKIAGGHIASRRFLGRTLSEAVSREVFRISAVALALILAVAFLFMRSLRMSLAALLPAACGVLWLFAIMGVQGLSLNVANMIAGIVVIGLCIDYGIFMVHGWCESADVLHSTRNAVMLSAITTLMGAGVLIFAEHPVLFSIGLTLVVGISSGFLAALLGVPGLCILFRIQESSEKS